MAQRLHWMHASGFHWGTVTATPRLEYAVVPFSQVPSRQLCLLNRDTGNLSPCWRSMGTTISLTKSVPFSSSGAPSLASAQAAGTSTFVMPVRPTSTARLFRSTISWPPFLK